MADLNEQTLHQKIDETPLKSSKQIEIQFFNKQSNKTTQLINNSSPEQFLSGRNDFFKFELSETIYCQKIVVETEGYKYKDAEFILSESQDIELSHDVKNVDDKFTLNCHRFINEFKFKPDRVHLKSTDVKIKSVQVHGYEISDLLTLNTQIKSISSIRNEAKVEATRLVSIATKKAAEAEKLDEEITNKKSQYDEAVKSADEATENLNLKRNELDKINSEIGRLKSLSKDNAARIEIQEGEIRKNRGTVDNLQNSINDLDKELKRLLSQKHLFPSELSEFSKKANQDKSFYWKLAALPLLVLTGMAIILHTNATDLSVKYFENDLSRLFSIFITRTPYVIVASAIITAMFSLASFLVKEIMKIDSQVRALNKISIIASDVSKASHHDLHGLSDRDISSMRITLKMELLRQHLKASLGTDFDTDSIKKLLLSGRIVSKATEQKESPEIQDSSPT